MISLRGTQAWAPRQDSLAVSVGKAPSPVLRWLYVHQQRVSILYVCTDDWWFWSDPTLSARNYVLIARRCLSRVYVAAEAKNGLIYYTVDSDSMLTKGLAAVLAQGLSGNSAEAIQLVKPYFVKMAGISTSLTPGCVFLWSV